MRLSDAVPLVKEAVSARQAADALGLRPDRYGRCQCPMHNGKDRNLKLYDGDKGYFCYVCHSGGDVIDLVRNVNGCGLKEAVAWLDSAFHLGLDVGAPTDDKRLREARKAADERRRQRDERKAFYERAVDAEQEALEVTMRIEDRLEEHQPKTYDEDFSDDFCDMLMWLEDMRIYRDDLAVIADKAREMMDNDGRPQTHPG